MSRCAACGHEDQAGGKFCPECGAALGENRSVAREERKVVTVLFADLVGFTSRSEQLDPEDVRAFLSPYYARLRTELEGFGGTVEKFIGDAVMALFGAPVAHEDDPERAVRAALAIRDWVVEQAGDLQLRIAVNTGEALIALGAHPGQGEGMASGDVVNTTARLQTAAPVNGILVGETTYRATAEVITYRAAEPVSAKGKALPVAAWEALEARSRLGVDLARVSRAPLAGRQRELNVLSDALERVRSDRSTQLVTLAAVPGMGKSRLVAELFRVADEASGELITWRQGRSLPYGDGVTFWALAEMVKAQAGILETDTQDQAETKLRAAVTGLLADPTDARWIEGHLRPLVGLSSGAEAGRDRHEEAFAAWRRFFEALAERGPLVLVFEDLHWADDNLLDFVEHLMGWAGAVPLLVVCTARPELFERRAGWGGGMRNSTTLWLGPLSEEETLQLISSLSDRPLMAAAIQQALLERSGGNPLYAEQYVRVLKEKRDAQVLALPETVQGIIAARLDALPIEDKRLLQSAAVIGKVFWLGALTAVGGADRRFAEQRLHALERKDFIQRARRSSVAQEVEYAFLHVLLRDVAYGQIPRGQRAEQHRVAAEWIASLGRPEDQAEMLAHHYGTAIDLCRAAGQEIEPALAEPALASLRDAGDRAFSLNAYASATHFYESALRLSSTGSLDNAQLLFKLGRTQFLVGVYEPDHLVVACAKLLSCGDREAAAEAQAVLAEMSWWRGNRDEALSHMRRARELVADLNPSRSTAYVLSRVAGDLMLAGESADAIRLASEALATAEKLGIDELRAHTMHTIGASKISRGDAAGIMDLERSAAIAVQANAAPEICMAQGSLASSFSNLGQLTRAWGILEESEETASRFGLSRESRWIRGERIAAGWTLGLWQEAMEGAETFLAEVEAGSPHYLAPSCYLVRAHIRLGRDDLPEALVDAERALELARATKDPQCLYPALVACAHIFSECGDLERADLLADECLVGLGGGGGVGFWIACTHMLAWALSALGRRDELLKALPDIDLPWVHAARSYASGDVRRAADICATMGAATEAARDRLFLAHALVEQNRPKEADVELQRALAFYRSVDATHYLRECEGLLANSA
jgi:class 3 adenylate cyclase